MIRLLRSAVFVALAGTGFVSHAQSGANTPVITGFSQPADDVLVLEFDREVVGWSTRSLDGVPTSIREPDIQDVNLAGADLRSVRIPLEEAERREEYSIILAFKDADCAASNKVQEKPDSCASAQFVEIVRQPSSWLEELFDFDRPGGYSILGRRNVRVESGVMEGIAPLEFVGVPDIGAAPRSPADINRAVSAYPELVEAARLIRLIWERDLKGGPTAKSYAEFLQEDFARKLEMLTSGEASAMCQGVRDLFLHATAAAPELSARGVEAYNYGPQFAELITYGHSTAEVWVEALNQWVLVDPWMGFALIDDDGRLLSAEDLLPSKRPDDIRTVPLIDEVRRFAQSPDGDVVVTRVAPSEVEMTDYIYTPVGHAPGFLTYFHEIHVRDFHINAEQ